MSSSGTAMKRKASDDEGDQPHTKKSKPPLPEGQRHPLSKKRDADDDGDEQPQLKKQKMSQPTEPKNDEFNQPAAHERQSETGEDIEGDRTGNSDQGAPQETTEKPADEANDNDGKESSTIEQAETGDDERSNDMSPHMQADLSKARALYSELVVLVELERHATTDRGSDVQLDAARRSRSVNICRLAADSGKGGNLFMSKLAGEWFVKVQMLNEAQCRTNGFKDGLSKCAAEIATASQTFEAAVSERTAFLHVASDEVPWPETAKEQERLGLTAQEELQRAQGEHIKLQERIANSLGDERALCAEIVLQAEEVLIDLDLLRGPKTLKAKLDEDGCTYDISRVDVREQCNTKANGDKENSAEAESGQPSEDERGAERTLQEKLDEGCALYTQLALLVEIARLDLGHDRSGQYAENQRAQTSQGRGLEEELCECKDQIVQAQRAFADAIVKRTDILHTAPDEDLWPETSKEQTRLASLAISALHQANTDYNNCKLQIRNSHEQEDFCFRIVVSGAEDALIEVDIIRGPKVLHEKPQQRRGQPDNQIPPVNTVAKPAPPAPTGESVPAGVERPPHNILDVVRQENRDGLKHARRTWSEASHNRRRVRESYRPELAKFLNEKKNGEIGGTKIDFDAFRYLRQQKAEHEYGRAENHYEYTKKMARKAGAIRREELTSDYGDWSDDGYDDISEDGYYDVLKDLRNETIEKWLSDQTQEEDIEGHGEDRSEMPGRKSEGRYLAPMVKLESVFAVAVGKDRKRIDKWQFMQEEVRESLDMRPLPDPPDGEDEENEREKDYWSRRFRNVV
ncbi:hypothetical protein LTR37_020733 [Vermiconidia calcicola]|uniref:Uncharacterized protein n=1 Tax=Vermiconidia calcicola TaxID=1690605 RepID=A0ACC3MBW9_9PEZI|nr:hypothetical protein LTR37_020733 [Vermiconidia calcicola]